MGDQWQPFGAFNQNQLIYSESEKPNLIPWCPKRSRGYELQSCEEMGTISNSCQEDSDQDGP
jgi:hypothetical protein